MSSIEHIISFSIYPHFFSIHISAPKVTFVYLLSNVDKQQFGIVKKRAAADPSSGSDSGNTRKKTVPSKDSKPDHDLEVGLSLERQRRKERGRLHLEESRRKFHEDQLVRKEEERKKEKEHRERLRVLQEESRERAREPVTVLLQREGREYNDHQGSVRGNTRKSISNKGRERGVRDIDKLEARQLRKFGVVIRPRELPSAAHSSDDDDEDNAEEEEDEVDRRLASRERRRKSSTIQCSYS